VGVHLKTDDGFSEDHCFKDFPTSQNIGRKSISFVFYLEKNIRVYTWIWVDLKIDGFFHSDFQRIARVRFS